MIHQYIAHITIEAETPLKVGSSKNDFLHDSPVQRDWNGLPMILGTSIAGVLRKDFGSNGEEVFGGENGSKVIFSNALLLNEDKNVEERLLLEKPEFLKIFDNLPIREHTAITDKGVAKEHSKFDEEVVYKGSRFRFSLLMLDDEKAFNTLLNLLASPAFRLGGGSTKGFGKFKVIDVSKVVIDSKEKLASYSSSLNSLDQGHALKVTDANSNYIRYVLQITPDNFFMFGSGFGDENADHTPVYEQVIDYDAKGLSDSQILIPASSVKGALSHRVAYYYNQAMGATIENGQGKVGEENDAVKGIFGHKKELAEDKVTKLGQKGKALFADCFQVIRKNHTKTFDHVAIDRFTGGGIDGALFQETTIAQKDTWEIEILLDKSVEDAYVESFEKSLDDICTGMLALGGLTTKGHGVFTGEIIKGTEVLHVTK